jgi:hypothetical protein
MNTKKIISLFLTLCISTIGLYGCNTNEKNEKIDITVATETNINATENNELILPTSDKTIETPTEIITENITETSNNIKGLVPSTSSVQILSYDDRLAKDLDSPDSVGASVFTVLTTNVGQETVITNIDNDKALNENMDKYNNVLSSETFNLLYDEEEKQLEYLVCGFSTTYDFAAPIEMFSVYSPLFDKNISYLISDMKYNKDNKTMYIFLKAGWSFYEEAHTTDQENILRDGMEKAKGATILFFNELNEEIQPERYILVLPEK